MATLGRERERSSELLVPSSQCGHPTELLPFSFLFGLSKKNSSTWFNGPMRSEALTLSESDNKLGDHEGTKDMFGCLPSAANWPQRERRDERVQQESSSHCYLGETLWELK